MSGTDRDDYDTYWGIKGDHCQARRWWLLRCRLNRQHGGNHLHTTSKSGYGKETQWSQSPKPKAKGDQRGPKKSF